MNEHPRLLNFDLVLEGKCIICFLSRMLFDIFSSFHPQEFLKKEFSEENVLFWLACEDFKKTQDKKQVLLLYNHILGNFLLSL